MTIIRESFGSQANSTATTTPTIAKPAGVAVGDVLVCAIAFNGSPGTITPPTGWVEVAFEIGASNPRLGLYYHVCDANEPANYTWTHTTSVASGMVIARYSGVDNTTPSDTAGVSSFSATTTSNFNATGITTVTDGAMVIGACSVNSGTTVITENSTIMTEVAEIGGKRCEQDSGILATAGATGVQNYTFSGARTCAAIIWALRPAASGTPVSVADSGSTTEQTTITAAGTIADTGSQIENIGITATDGVSDSGAGIDALQVSVTISLADTAGGSENVSHAVGLTDIPVTDSGNGNDTVSISGIVAIGDTSSSVDGLAGIIASVLAAEAGHGTDAPGPITVVLSIPESASGVDAVSLGQEIYKTLTDSGLGAESLSVAVNLSPGDSGYGSEQIGVTVTFTVGDQAAANEAIGGINSLLGLADFAAGTEMVTISDSSKKIIHIRFQAQSRTIATQFAARSELFDFGYRKVDIRFTRRFTEFSGFISRRIGFILTQ